MCAVLVITVALGQATTVEPALAEHAGGIPGTARLDASALDLGTAFGCAVVGDGGVRCWGSGHFGQLAQGDMNNQGDSPGESTVVVPLPRPAVAVAAGAFHACAILDNGLLRCWGDNEVGQLGQGNTDQVGDHPGTLTVPVDLGVGRTAVAVTAGHFHTCALLDNGAVRCWGANSYGQLGQGSTAPVGTDPGQPPTALVALPAAAATIAAGYESTCAVLVTGELRCWGQNSSGQLMQGNVAAYGDNGAERTAHVDTGGHAVLAISGGLAHFCAIYDDHSLHCWGASESGQLGLGRTDPFGDTPTETNVGPVILPAGRTAAAVAAGGNTSCVLLDDGELRCFGDGSSGQLGQGSTGSFGGAVGESTEAVNLGGPVHAVAVGNGTACAVSDAGLRCWGLNSSGQLGQGSAQPFGGQAGELPALLPTVPLGGQHVGRDSDGDGVRDAVDACPTVPAQSGNGCAAAATPPEAVLKGRKVVIDALMTKTKASATCPHAAKVKVRTKAAKGKVSVVKQLRSRTVPGGCRVKGKVKLPAKPVKKAKVKVTITGKKLRTKHLVAVRP
jgi:alpha-tubulin suppressor-like RCC1 family protein